MTKQQLDKKNLIIVARGLAEAMLSNPSITNPHMEENPIGFNIMDRALNMAEYLIMEAEERTKA